jgi:hypothetical protein
MIFSGNYYYVIVPRITCNQESPVQSSPEKALTFFIPGFQAGSGFRQTKELLWPSGGTGRPKPCACSTGNDNAVVKHFFIIMLISSQVQIAFFTHWKKMKYSLSYKRGINAGINNAEGAAGSWSCKHS